MRWPNFTLRINAIKTQGLSTCIKISNGGKSSEYAARWTQMLRGLHSPHFFSLAQAESRGWKIYTSIICHFVKNIYKYARNESPKNFNEK